MTATDELREYVINADGMGMTHGHAKSIYAIADRIDAEHEADVSTACRLAAGLDNDALAKRGYIKLPVDADGVPIHIGDMVEDASVREIIEQVMQIRYTLATSSKAPTVLTSIITDASQLPQKSSDYRHYRAPTVEDVLREFAEKITDSQIPNVHPTYEEAIAEYAAKLRLAEGVDE